MVTITMNADVDAAPIAFSGHMDTVYAVGSFGTPAVKMDRENDKIYGPGVTDRINEIWRENGLGELKTVFSLG